MSFNRGNDDRRDRASREMFKTVCSNCGRECEVPFQPTSGKPVYCDDCFREKNGRGESGSGERRENRDRRDRGDRRGGGRPDRFGGGRFDDRRSQSPAPSQSNEINQIKFQIDQLNAKMDRILGIIAPAPVEEAVEEAESAPAPKKTKTTKKKTAEVAIEASVETPLEVPEE
ncbi:MAG TPA: CxxC-x17-CxxC domain-containing protein [Patescibacteria group bacterium]|nr:CxxC-x17-CxxC domain-containing protein [Patescibacteria group bacterium]